MPGIGAQRGELRGGERAGHGHDGVGQVQPSELGDGDGCGFGAAGAGSRDPVAAAALPVGEGVLDRGLRARCRRTCAREYATPAPVASTASVATPTIAGATCAGQPRDRPLPDRVRRPMSCLKTAVHPLFLGRYLPLATPERHIEATAAGTLMAVAPRRNGVQATSTAKFVAQGRLADMTTPSSASNSSIQFGVDIGGTGIKGAPVDLSTGQLTAERVRLATPHPATPEAVGKVVAEVVKHVRLDRARSARRSRRRSRAASR